jgi:hypothetical protein
VLPNVSLLLFQDRVLANFALADYKRVEDIQGECDMMSKKSTIARVRGDKKLADDWARRYIALYDRHMRTLDDSDEDLVEA